MNEQPSFPNQHGQTGYDNASDSLGSAAPSPQASLAASRQQGPAIEWQASEYIHHNKGPLWLVPVGIVVVALLGLTIWLQAYTFTVLIAVMAVTFVIFAFRQPRILQYRLDADGLHVHDKFYPYSDFRAYGILQEGIIYSVVLLPAKRLMPAISMYFEEKDGEAIIDAVGQHLPQQPVKLDIFDSLMRRFHF